jgi:hypothetical protein
MVTGGGQNISTLIVHSTLWNFDIFPLATYEIEREYSYLVSVPMTLQ